MKILALTRYGALGASSRMRTYQYLPLLADAGIDLDIMPLFNDTALSRRYKTGHYKVSTVVLTYAQRIFTLIFKKKYDLVWIEKEALPWMPHWFESALLRGTTYVLDYDDALFHKYDLHRYDWVRSLFGRRLDRLMSKSALVVGGNEYLASRAKRAGARRVEIVPTSIDLERYSKLRFLVSSSDKVKRVVWIGSPSTARYLELLRNPLRELALKQPFVFRVIGAKINWPDVDVECLPWSAETEVSSIVECDVGVMPLLDSPWERGKCGYKLIQYMACGLPVIASPVGVNSEIVQDGKNGFLATTSQEWQLAIERLLTDSALALRMGQVGRSRVETNYSLQVTGPQLVELLKETSVGSN